MLIAFTRVSPVIGWISVPGTHKLHSGAPASEYLPASQLMQTLLVCPGERKYLPSTQLVQTETPVAPEYVPDTHSLQKVAPAPENLPAGHAMHDELPWVSLYLPASHAVQFNEPEPVYPGLQSHTAELVLGEYELGGHAMHE